MRPQYRPATIQDYDAMLQLWKNTPGMGLSDVADSRAGILRLLERNPGLSTVAELDNTIIGTAVCSHDGRRGFIYHLAVAEAFQKHGIGRTLVEMSLWLFHREGITRATIVAYRNNEPGQDFWRKLGWRFRDDVVMFSKDV